MLFISAKLPCAPCSGFFQTALHTFLNLLLSALICCLVLCMFYIWCLVSCSHFQFVCIYIFNRDFYTIFFSVLPSIFLYFLFLQLCVHHFVFAFISFDSFPHTLNARVKGHLEPTHLKSWPLFTFSTKSLGQDSPSVYLFSVTIWSRFTAAKIKLGEVSPSWFSFF